MRAEKFVQNFCGKGEENRFFVDITKWVNTIETGLSHNRLRRCGLNPSGPVQGLLAGLCEPRNELSRFVIMLRVPYLAE